MRVYLVRFHDGSDFDDGGRILGVFSTPERARKAIADFLEPDIATIQPLELDTPDTSEVR